MKQVNNWICFHSKHTDYDSYIKFDCNADNLCTVIVFQLNPITFPNTRRQLSIQQFFFLAEKKTIVAVLSRRNFARQIFLCCFFHSHWVAFCFQFFFSFRFIFRLLRRLVLFVMVRFCFSFYFLKSYKNENEIINSIFFIELCSFVRCSPYRIIHNGCKWRCAQTPVRIQQYSTI